MANKTPKKNGRPKIKIEWETVEELCTIQCTGKEIAAFLKIGYSTIERRCKEDHKETFEDYIKRNSQGGKSSLRRAQWKKAVVEGNTTMLIWLGKQYLDQKDKVEELDTSGINWEQIGKVGAAFAEALGTSEISSRTTPVDNGDDKV